MRKIMLKTICIFTLVFLVLSMTGAAACSNSCNTKTDTINTACSNSCNTKTDAINDCYSFNLKKCPHTAYCFRYDTLLKNDKGCNLKVTTTGTYKTKLGGQVTIYSDGKFCYKASSTCCSKKCCTCTDTFTYKIKGKDGKTDCATATLKLKCPTC
ncbi:hypothetical protein MSBRW_2651 [Methanosarcina barkeri str. Wiesmoor]|uniref:Uncharacterized protein n=2 Tax=Methanosarcina barkeri TaxID=2208 RepID=A0A0E3QPM2_METBA|nr:hypothetical protein MSBRW_2651 [Methanosarcina barkeri str. Wiesmoor]